MLMCQVLNERVGAYQYQYQVHDWMLPLKPEVHHVPPAHYRRLADRGTDSKHNHNTFTNDERKPSPPAQTEWSRRKALQG